jgi:hypothetical protein
MRFGWLTLSHSPSADGDHAAIEEQLAQAVHAEAVVQSHAPLTVLSSGGGIQSV